MDINTLSNLLNQIHQLSNQNSNINHSTSQLRAPAQRMPGSNLFDTLGKASQDFLFHDATSTIKKEILSIFQKDTAATTAQSAAGAASSSAATQAGNAAAQTATAAEAGSAAAESGAVASSTLSSLASVGGFLYGGYQLIKNWGTKNPVGGAINGAVMGAGAVGTAALLGAQVGSFGGPIGMAIGAAVGGLLGFIKTGKHKDQIKRDQFREVLQNNGIIDKDFTIGLADGSRYDIGIDGGKKAEFGNMRPYELDTTDPMVGRLIGLVNPFMTVLSGGDKKIQSDFTGYFVRAAMSNANGDLNIAKQNVLAIFNQIQISPDDLVNNLGALAQNGKISEDELLAYLNGVRDMLTPEDTTAAIN